MKQMVYGIVTATMVVITMGIVMAVVGKMNRKSDLDNALSVAVEDAVESTMNQKTYTCQNYMEFIADFTQNLLLQISNDSDIEVSIAKVDYEKGLMSVKVTETFTHPNGNEGKNECETTVVFEQVSTDAELVTISYQLDADTTYKEYQITKGDDVIVPKDPLQEGKNFVGWGMEGCKDMVTDFGKANEDMTYIAVFQ
ncbi:MAG: hypothetical protein PUB19_08100 [Lachnospiraceae bacterium]|nr:hypothetical protein [Lachnospiraceae bacterium]